MNRNRLLLKCNQAATSLAGGPNADRSRARGRAEKHGETASPPPALASAHPTQVGQQSRQIDEQIRNARERHYFINTQCNAINCVRIKPINATKKQFDFEYSLIIFYILIFNFSFN